MVQSSPSKRADNHGFLSPLQGSDRVESIQGRRATRLPLANFFRALGAHHGGTENIFEGGCFSKQLQRP